MSENIGIDLASYGEPVVKTPNLDKMAKEGVQYNKAFTTSPVCSPSRAVIVLNTYEIYHRKRL